MAKVELGCDWRARPPAVLEIGPVPHPDDAVANKVITLFGRAAPRDCLDVNAALASGRYSGGRLLQLASEHDAGFDPRYFAQALRAVDRWPNREYEAYGVAGGQVRTCADGCAPGLPRSSMNGSTRDDPAGCVDPEHPQARATSPATASPAPRQRGTVTESSERVLVEVLQ